MKHGVFAIGINALRNSSRDPVSREDVVAVLKSGDGPGNLVRALFEDCALESLDRMAAEIDMSPRDLRVAYETARAKHHARSLEIEESFSV